MPEWSPLDELRHEIDSIQALEAQYSQAEEDLVRGVGGMIAVVEETRRRLQRCYQLFAEVAAAARRAGVVDNKSDVV